MGDPLAAGRKVVYFLEPGIAGCRSLTSQFRGGSPPDPDEQATGHFFRLAGKTGPRSNRIIPVSLLGHARPSQAFTGR
jgi:hypothetical protein